MIGLFFSFLNCSLQVKLWLLTTTTDFESCLASQKWIQTPLKWWPLLQPLFHMTSAIWSFRLLCPRWAGIIFCLLFQSVFFFFLSSVPLWPPFAFHIPLWSEIWLKLVFSIVKSKWAQPVHPPSPPEEVVQWPNSFELSTPNLDKSVVSFFLTFSLFFFSFTHIILYCRRRPKC